MVRTEGFSHTSSDHPYGKWIEMYPGDEYQAVASSAVTFLDQLDKRRGGDARFDGLAKNFKTATELRDWLLADGPRRNLNKFKSLISTVDSMHLELVNWIE